MDAFPFFGVIPNFKRIRQIVFNFATFPEKCTILGDVGVKFPF